MFLKKRKQSGWTAICLYPGRVDIARISRNDEQLRLDLLESFERPAALDEALTRLRKKFGLDSCACTTLATSGQYQLLQVEAPAVPRAEMKEAVRWKIQDQIDYPVEQATIDVLDIETPGGGSGRPHSVYVVAASNGALELLIRSFAESGIALEAIDIPEMAQRNLAALCEDKDRGLAMLSFDETGGLLTFTFHAELYMVRRIEIPLQTLAEAGDERRAQLFERIGLELQRSMDNFDRQFSFIPLTRLLLTPGPVADALCVFLGDYLSMPVEVLDLATVIEIDSVPGLANVTRQAQCLGTLGAALRQEVGAA